MNSSSLIPSPCSLFVSANRNEHYEGLLILSSDWQQFSASPSYEHLASTVVLLFYSQVSCDDKQGEGKENELTSNNLQRRLANQQPASQKGAKHFCQNGWKLWILLVISWIINLPDTDVQNNACVSKYVHKVRAYVTLDHKTSHKSLGYICSNSQKYIVWVKIINFSFMPKIIRIVSKECVP